MSGHSKWSTIKRKKGALDAKRGAIFTKIANMITIAAKEGGGDPDTNPKLAVPLEKAKAANMPKDNIERAIKKGTGELEGVTLESLTIEAYGPNGSAFIAEAITDNKNRTISEIRNILSQNNGKLAESGSVAYQFDRRGVIVVDQYDEEVELQAIDAGAKDTKIENEQLIILTEAADLDKVKTSLKNAKIISADIEMVPQAPLSVKEEDKTKIENLENLLLEHDDVNEVYTNVL